ncbi:MAG: hypothetical protein VXZ82_21830, partial [Planctomycetota bacterium]|nr:hypothetical protein [Planctomycetota bacterium]
MSLAKSRDSFLALAPLVFGLFLTCSAKVGWAADPVEASTRWATFEEEGNQFFALSVQADPTGNYPKASGVEVVVLMDTSATQTGPVRLESLEVLEELALSLPAGSKINLMACDVETVAMSSGFVSARNSQWQEAMAKLKKRIPLGTTNLGLAFETAAKQFQSDSAQRTIVYIGDGVNRTNLLSSDEHRNLVKKLVEQRITVSSLAIGPAVDVANLASFANHTGGVLFSRNEIEESSQLIGRNLGLSCLMPVVWVEDAKLPKALQVYFPQQFPPLRVDRDTIIVGKSDEAPAAGELKLTASVNGQAVEVLASAEPEAANPDMAFLALVIDAASKDGGLTLPTLGSDGLRAMSFALADSATSMVKSGVFALKAGEVESAIRIAEEALKNDPNNADAVNLLNAAKKVASSDVPTAFRPQQDPFGGNSDPFGNNSGGNSDPFGNSATPAAGDPFGGAAAPAAPAATPATAAPADATLATATPADETPAGPPVFLDEKIADGQLLADMQAAKDIRTQALQVEIENRISSAGKIAGKNPILAKNMLKGALEFVDSATDVDATIRGQLRDKVGSQVKLVAAAEAKYLNEMQRTETVRAQADQTQRLLAQTNRREESLKQLVEQFNYLMATQRYNEANDDVAPEISRKAPDSVIADVSRVKSMTASNQALVKQAFRDREQGFIGVMTTVEQAAIPFSGDPPIVYPPPEVWQALSARRKERYGSINLAGGSEAEGKIYQALKQQIEPDYPGTSLKAVMEDLAGELNIPIYIKTDELDLLGVDVDTPVSLTLPKVSVRSALRLILEPLELTYIVRNEVLEITSQENADSDPINKVYPVGDLVVPPSSGMGMMGGMGGGMGGMGGGMG